MKDFENDVLFQKMGNIWYVFTLKDNEVFYSPLPKGIDPHKNKFEFYEVVEDCGDMDLAS